MFTTSHPKSMDIDLAKIFGIDPEKRIGLLKLHGDKYGLGIINSLHRIVYTICRWIDFHRSLHFCVFIGDYLTFFLQNYGLSQFSRNKQELLFIFFEVSRRVHDIIIDFRQMLEMYSVFTYVITSIRKSTSTGFAWKTTTLFVSNGL